MNENIENKKEMQLDLSKYNPKVVIGVLEWFHASPYRSYANGAGIGHMKFIDNIDTLMDFVKFYIDFIKVHGKGSMYYDRIPIASAIDTLCEKIIDNKKQIKENPNNKSLEEIRESLLYDPESKLTQEKFLWLVSCRNITKKCLNILAECVYVSNDFYMDNMDKISEYFPKFKRRNPDIGKDDSVKLLHELTNTRKGTSVSIAERLTKHHGGNYFDLVSKTYTLKQMKMYPNAFNWLSIINDLEHDDIREKLEKEGSIKDTISEVAQMLKDTDISKFNRFCNQFTSRLINMHAINHQGSYRINNYDNMCVLEKDIMGYFPGIIDIMIENFSNAKYNGKTINSNADIYDFMSTIDINNMIPLTQLSFSGIFAICLMDLKNASEKSKENRLNAILNMAEKYISAFNHCKKRELPSIKFGAKETEKLKLTFQRCLDLAKEIPTSIIKKIDEYDSDAAECINNGRIYNSGWYNAIFTGIPAVSNLCAFINKELDQL